MDMTDRQEKVACHSILSGWWVGKHKANEMAAIRYDSEIIGRLYHGFVECFLFPHIDHTRQSR
jgi:hypothetical protein